MKKTIFILCVVLSILLIMWMVGRLRRGGNAKVGEYMASNRDTEIVIYDIDDLEAMAAEIIPHGAFDYIRGGAETENTLRRNVESFDAVDIYPRVLTGVEQPDTTTSVLGTVIAMPIIAAPAAAHGLAHTSAEAGTARGVAAANTIMSVSNYASSTLEDIAKAGAGAPQWFQLYLSKDDDFNRQIVNKAEKLGYKAIILTVDAPVGGNRVADSRNNFKFPLSLPNVSKKTIKTKGHGVGAVFAASQNKLTPYDVMRVKAMTDLPVIVKGVQHPDDADVAIWAGADAIWVSNHGGRQLDGAPASFEVLKQIAERVDNRVPIIFDSGVRRGQHIFKAIASGADVVAIGRPIIYGLALGGWRGVESVLDYLQMDLQRVMTLAGTQNIAEIKDVSLRPRCDCVQCGGI